MRTLAGKRSWNVDDSEALYHVANWGSSYYSINSGGNLVVLPEKQENVATIELTEVIQRATERGMQLPLIVRFPQILNNRIHELHGAFTGALTTVKPGGGKFQGVYPVKCNPDRFLVEDIVKFGRELDFGLEAGSKPELVMAMACMCKASPDALLICNGYKDAEYVKLALVARQLGINCVLVLEQEQEVDLIMEAAKSMDGVRPVIGLRAKLSTKHAGHWGDTSGENGKFGLSAMEIVDIVRKLKKNGMLDCLQLLHFHVGSQIPSLSIVKESASEAAHIWCDLKLMGADMKYLDVGGGLGIDYSGSNSSASHMSVGYNVQEYAAQVVEAVDEACSLKKMERLPVICCESGRGLVSHHSVLVFDVFSACRRGSSAPNSKGNADKVKLLVEQIDSSNLPVEVFPTWQQLAGFIQEESYAVAFDFAKGLKTDLSDLFKAGLVNLQQRALMEELCEVLASLVDENLPPHGGWKFETSNKQPVTYNMNMSMFKSMPDTWAIGQLFPIVPLQRLDEEPTVSAILSDLTCDSDGRIRDFMTGDACYSKSLPVHSLEPGKSYYMGVFLGGAYQEALGSMHNLFGGMNVVHVVSNHGRQGAGSFEISREIPGQNMSSVLRLVQHDPACLFDSLRSRLIKALHEGRFENECDARVALVNLARTLSAYTYLGGNHSDELQQAPPSRLLQRKQRSCFDNICSPMESSHSAALANY